MAAYLIDTRGLDEMPEKLELEWKGGTATGFSVTVDVRASDDLAHWRKRSTRSHSQTCVPVTPHSFAEKSICRALKADYLRLEWPNSLRDVQLSAVQAMFPPPQQPPTRLTLRVIGVRSGDAKTHTSRYKRIPACRRAGSSSRTRGTWSLRPCCYREIEQRDGKGDDRQFFTIWRVTERK